MPKGGVMEVRRIRVALSALFVTVWLTGGPTVRPAGAAIDINGAWGMDTDVPEFGPSSCVIDVTQTGSALAIDGYCLGSYDLALTGTIDTMSGALSASGSGG